MQRLMLRREENHYTGTETYHLYIYYIAAWSACVSIINPIFLAFIIQQQKSLPRAKTWYLSQLSDIPIFILSFSFSNTMTSIPAFSDVYIIAILFKKLIYVRSTNRWLMN